MKFWGAGLEQIIRTMISSKILVFRGLRGTLQTEAVQDNPRRKKSCGDLFHNGYRVRTGEAKESNGLLYSLTSCLRVLSNWGKRVRPGVSPVLTLIYDVFGLSLVFI